MEIRTATTQDSESEGSGLVDKDTSTTTSTEREASLPKRPSILIACLYCACVFFIGAEVGSFGPSIIPLGKQVGVGLGAVAFGASVRALSSLASSLGVTLLDHFAGHVLLACAVGVGGLGAALVPACTSVVELYLCLGAIGVAAGFGDNGANILLIWTFSTISSASVQTWLQALHFCYAAGSTLSPLMQSLLLRGCEEKRNCSVGTFLVAGILSCMCALALCATSSPRRPRLNVNDIRVSTVNQSSQIQTTVACPSIDAQQSTVRVESDPTHADESSDTLNVGNPTSESHVLLSVPTSVKPAADDFQRSDAQLVSENATASLFCCPLRTAFAEWSVVTLGALVVLLHVGAAFTYGTFIAVYGVLQLGFSQDKGQLLSAAFWGSVMVGRAVGIIASVWLSPTFLLASTLLGSAVVSFVLSIGAPEGFVWVMTVLLGVFMAPQIPATFALSQSYVPLHARHMTAFSIAGSVGAWLFPFIVWVGMSDNTVPGVSGTRILTVVTAGCAINVLVFAGFVYTGRKFAHARADSTGAF